MQWQHIASHILHCVNAEGPPLLIFHLKQSTKNYSEMPKKNDVR